MKRWDWERELRRSDLPPLTRLVLLVLATYSDAGTADIPAEFGPSLTDLGRASGVDRRTVARHLNRAEALRWVLRRRPPVELARSRKARTAYTLMTPASGSVPLAEPLTSGTRPPALVAQGDMASGTVPLKPVLARSKPELRAIAIVQEHTDASDEEAQAVVDLVRREKTPTRLAGFLVRLGEDGELPDWLDRVRAELAELAKAAAGEALADIRANGPPCPHGQPGGLSLHPVWNDPLCPLCRRGVGVAS